jgi:G:T-mismatch repair DNA endonuclease (very short patch repair protein)
MSANRKYLIAKYGYETLIIWEQELKNLIALKEKLSKFNGSN